MMILLLKNSTGWNVLTNDWTMVEKRGVTVTLIVDDCDYINVRLTIDAVQDHIRRSSVICDLRSYCE